ncbi:hypothetical protein [Moheibacter sediminis]|uniref:Uncharacterized protein n=1 Tax=Moheibacter sediminis TaxID=1434700 RepID=A0A1W2AH32_9FLAO|nr:hypothetical protein [Moheibacter sediminis]SMC59995.1 hypothetical protein SAMN06296427_104164 [Moheibacter sediminis]
MKQIILAALFVTPLVLNAQEKPLKPEQVKKENAATAIQEKEVAAQKSEAEVALAEGKEIVVKDTTHVYSVKSVAENSGFGQALAFEGIWKVDLNLAKKEIVVTGGTMKNLTDKPSNNLRIMVYFADKEFDLQKPDLIGTEFLTSDIETIAAQGKKESQSFISELKIETPLPAGRYYPYLLLGELNPQTQQYDVKDIKVFKEFISLP